MKAMLLAAGRGKRMRELTEACPKPLLQVAGKALIEWQIERLVAAGVTELVINCGYLGEQLPAYLGDGQRYGAQIAYSIEPSEGLETGGGIVKALPLLGDEPFMVVNSDIWTDFDYANAVLPAGKLAHLVLVSNPEHNPEGDFQLHGDGRIGTEGEAKLTFSGIGIYARELFASKDEGFFPLAPILREAMIAHRVSGQQHIGQWMDVGTPERLAEIAEHLSR